MRRIRLQYGTEGLDLEVDAPNVTVVEPRYVPGLPDEAAAFREAVRAPIGRPPLREIVRANERVAVVIPDITRPLPSDRLLPWLFEELSHVPAANFVIVNGTGSHRANTPEELERMVGARIARSYRIVNHDAHDPSTHERAGTTKDGRTVYMNREYVRADRRIVLGFIEPHFMAGFSGGYKGVFPAIADIDSIMHYHRAAVIADPRSTWGVLEGNPTQEQIRHNGSLLPVDFCVNVTLNRDRRITGFYCGDPLEAHRRGSAFVRKTAMVACPEPFPVVVTTNGGYPLDQNLYQAVKGMSAGAQIVAPGGYILAAARCNDGFPSHGNFRKLLFEHASPQALLDTVLAPGFSMFDQWEAQILANILLRARVGLRSEIPDDEVRRAHLEPVADVSRRLSEELRRAGRDAPVAVLPEGPMTIPYLGAA
ncbi:MAG TPA: nickel-dependent lactate racemase [Planctomycetota bacterium]|nr:nickel-dependent lactate racemase [Planctomycetota bacterium]